MGARGTATVAGRAPTGTPAGTILLDDVTMSNVGLTEELFRRGRSGDGVRSAIRLRHRLVHGDKFDQLDGSATSPSGQGRQRRRHGLAPPPRSRSGYEHFRSHPSAFPYLRRRVDIRTAHRHGRRTCRWSGQRPAEFGGQLGFRLGGCADTECACLQSRLQAAIEPAPSVPLDHLVGAQAQADQEPDRVARPGTRRTRTAPYARRLTAPRRPHHGPRRRGQSHVGPLGPVLTQNWSNSTARESVPPRRIPACSESSTPLLPCAGGGCTADQ